MDGSSTATATPQTPAPKKITLKGDPAIDSDGSSKAFDYTTDDGKYQIGTSGPSGFYVVDKGIANSVEFDFKEKGGVKSVLIQPGTHLLKSKTSHGVDPDTVSFVALTDKQAQELGVHLGDKVKVTYAKNGKQAEAVYGDEAGVKVKQHLEMSPALAKELGIGVDSKGRTQGTDENSTFTVEALPTPPVTTAKKVGAGVST